MSQLDAKIRVKKTDGGRTLDNSTYTNVTPDYGELVFSHSSSKDELVIGDGTHTIPNLPRLNFQKLSQTSLIKSGSTAPTSPSAGDLWVDISNPDTPILKVFVNNTWKPIVGVWG